MKGIINFEVTAVTDQAGQPQVAVVAQDQRGDLWIKVGRHGQWEKF